MGCPSAIWPRNFRSGDCDMVIVTVSPKKKTLINTDVQLLKKMKTGTVKSFVSIMKKWKRTAAKDYGALKKLVDTALNPVRTS